MARFVRWFAVLIFLGLATNSIRAGETITDARFGFTLALPDGFQKQQITPDLPAVLYAYLLEKTADDSVVTMVIVEDLKSMVPQQSLRRQDLPVSFQGKLFTMSWNGWNLDTATVIEDYRTSKSVTFNVQIPLKRGGVMLKLLGPADNEEELKKLLADILSGLNGESNWSATPPTSQPNDDTGSVAILIGIVFLLAMAVFYSISRTQPRFVVLIAGLTFALSLLIQPGNTRELILVVGSMKMIGGFGMIMGFVMSFCQERKRKLLNIQKPSRHSRQG